MFPAWNPSLEEVSDDTVDSRNTDCENSRAVLAASFGAERRHEGYCEASVAYEVKELIRPNRPKYGWRPNGDGTIAPTNRTNATIRTAFQRDSDGLYWLSSIGGL